MPFLRALPACLTHLIHHSWANYYLAHDNPGPTRGVPWDYAVPASALALAVTRPRLVWLPGGTSSTSSSSTDLHVSGGGSGAAFPLPLLTGEWLQQLVGAGGRGRGTGRGTGRGRRTGRGGRGEEEADAWALAWGAEGEGEEEEVEEGGGWWGRLWGRKPSARPEEGVGGEGAQRVEKQDEGAGRGSTPWWQRPSCRLQAAAAAPGGREGAGHGAGAALVCPKEQADAYLQVRLDGRWGRGETTVYSGQRAGEGPGCLVEEARRGRFRAALAGWPPLSCPGTWARVLNNSLEAWSYAPLPWPWARSKPQQVLGALGAISMAKHASNLLDPLCFHRYPLSLPTQAVDSGLPLDRHPPLEQACANHLMAAAAVAAQRVAAAAEGALAAARTGSNGGGGGNAASNSSSSEARHQAGPSELGLGLTAYVYARDHGLLDVVPLPRTAAAPYAYLEDVEAHGGGLGLLRGRDGSGGKGGAVGGASGADGGAGGGRADAAEYPAPPPLPALRQDWQNPWPCADAPFASAVRATYRAYGWVRLNAKQFPLLVKGDERKQGKL